MRPLGMEPVTVQWLAIVLLDPAGRPVLEPFRIDPLQWAWAAPDLAVFPVAGKPPVSWVNPVTGWQGRRPLGVDVRVASARIEDADGRYVAVSLRLGELPYVGLAPGDQYQFDWRNPVEVTREVLASMRWLA